MGLARRLREALTADPSQGFERIIEPGNRSIPLDFRIDSPETAMQLASDPLSGIGNTDLYSDGSRLDDQRVGAAVAYKPLIGLWRSRLAPLGAGFEVFDAELIGVVEALEWWCHQREKLYAGLAEAGVKAPQDSEQCPEARLFQDPKATTALLAFIGAIREREDNQQAWEQAYKTDNWGIEALDEGEREGEG
ncbi:uncharacterized protein TRUGW13939_01046 [Talaromyces rugulosus]|uniref:Uncharacterized protein n=1 Tax=Talaromyces rugulosus TaxID=121627 RepID=A0A7H8QJ99_TALRU|nr:uncharacterized protein TRUGW13939_01046 [Talaromyces rugulosus]QKX53966.1 hypothetical protein TRUGW13939_01046 [Talaromyces rugulosus]